LNISYAADVREKLDARDKEIECVKKYGRAAIKANSQVLADVLTLLEVEGYISVPRLARDIIGVDKEILECYAERLCNKNQAGLARNKKGTMVIHLLNYDFSSADANDDEEGDSDYVDDEVDEKETLET
jgi:hypothetical protein